MREMWVRRKICDRKHNIPGRGSSRVWALFRLVPFVGARMRVARSGFQPAGRVWTEGETIW